MSATAIVRALLVTHAPLTALVPAARIIAGIIPQNTTLPAISITEISSNPKITTTRRATATEPMESRVQVTVLTKGENAYRQLKAILHAAKLGKGVHTGVIAGFDVNSVMPVNVNPEIPPADDGIYEQSRDFMVVFAEPN